MLYDSSDNLESVELTPSTRRVLTPEGNDAAEVEGRLLEFDDCTTCEEAWDALCMAVSSVCKLVDYGSPFSPRADASVDTTCKNFGSACSNYEAIEACEDHCPDEGLYPVRV